MNKYSKFQDIREITYKNRLKLGFFPEYREWQEAAAEISEHSLKINQHPVMEDWEEGYMEQLASAAASSGGRVLEVGYGMGISARHIQKHRIEEHVIIEANKDVFKHLQSFASEARAKVSPLFGFWQDVTASLPNGSFTGILFDTYPLNQEEVHVNHFYFFNEAFRLLRPGGTLTYYSDEIEDFSPEHRQRLQAAGFQDIQKRICKVKPPPECLYWKSNTILVPVIRK